jgi:hypothetical protein
MAISIISGKINTIQRYQYFLIDIDIFVKSFKITVGRFTVSTKNGSHSRRFSTRSRRPRIRERTMLVLVGGRVGPVKDGEVDLQQLRSGKNDVTARTPDPSVGKRFAFETGLELEELVRTGVGLFRRCGCREYLAVLNLLRIYQRAPTSFQRQRHH